MPLLSSSEPTIQTQAADASQLVARNARDVGCATCFDFAAQISLVDALCRAAVLKRLSGLRGGELVIVDVDDVFCLGDDANVQTTVRIHSPRFWRTLALGGCLAVEEAYLRGEWTCDNLLELLRLLSMNRQAVRQLDGAVPSLSKAWRRLQNWRQRNTCSGSRRNIADHYDLSNEFFALMLDDTMAYSAGIFETPDSSLGDASRAKFDRVCQKLDLRPEHHLLEIGCGWGGLAMHAAKNYGCRVTATTISQQQYDYAQEAIRRSGLQDRITLLLTDYRELKGRFDRIASIEMIEAVGRRYLPQYFSQCDRLLRTGGSMLLQAITIQEQRYDTYRKSRDFIQHYIFPGGFLPAISTIAQHVKRDTNLRMLELVDFGQDYARTLACWRARFWNEIDQVRRLKFDERFIRMWDFYLCYSQVGFEERTIGVSQILLSKGN